MSTMGFSQRKLNWRLFIQTMLRKLSLQKYNLDQICLLSLPGIVIYNKCSIDSLLQNAKWIHNTLCTLV